MQRVRLITRLSKGLPVDVKTAQARLGHSDPRLTLGVYVQATTEGDRAAADVLGDLLEGDDNEVEENGMRPKSAPISD